MTSHCRTILRHLENASPLVLTTMMDSHGSAPRSAGARMLVREDGSIEGTVGGGRYEARCITVALELHKLGRALAAKSGLSQAMPGAVLDFSLSGVSDMDMVCGGSLSLLLEYLPASSATRAVYAAACRAEEAGQAFAFISRFSPDSESDVFARANFGACQASGELRRCRVERCVFLPQSLMLVPPGQELPEEILEQARSLRGLQPRRLLFQETEYLLEPFPRASRLLIFGGGHVGREVAKLASEVDFQVTVIDDRPEFAALERFPGADAQLLPSLAQRDSAGLLSRLDPGPLDAVLIVTRGHAHDRDVLAAALPGRAGYIGMIGSKSKREAVYEQLQSQGFDAGAFAAVHSPVGLDIGAQTPVEIAVSIVAELIAWRKARRDAPPHQDAPR
ncbi:XdhC family protein [Desulfovibrio sp. OttesenSCG-928-M16]|nr:XdhC family protein [Desulfovibrio sp. OttesenSCG-928-M16]